MAGRLAGKVVLISGAASGIGAATARLFAAEGASLGLCDIDRDGLDAVVAEITETGGVALGVLADISAAEDVERWVARTAEAFGRVDALFSNAGVGGKGTVVELDEIAFYRTLAVNLGGAFLSSKYAIPHMASAGGGAVVFTASELALVGSRRNVAYTASKAALIGLARSMALDHAPQGIRVNVLCPGAVETPMLRRSIDLHEDSAGYESLIINEIALQRVGRAEEIAKAALFLVSDESSFVTGTTLVADGGATAQ
jgi:NAD(P)-dependent dehydrogenase (short-subunit alcohol dehydrogenase family)